MRGRSGVPRLARLVGWLALVVAVVATAGCKRKPAPADTTLVEASFTFDAAVYHFAEPAPGAREEAKRILVNAHLAISAIPLTLPPKVPTAAILTPKVAAFPPPGKDALASIGHGLSAEDAEALQRAAAVTAISVSGPADRAMATYRVALEAIAALEKAAPGVIVDGETREAFSRQKHADRAAAFTGDLPQVRRHVVVHVYRNGELYRAVSLGMRKFGLPDLSVPEVAAGSSGAMVELMGFVMQSFVEHPVLPRAGEIDLDIPALKGDPQIASYSRGATERGSGKGTLHLVKAKTEQGDAENGLLALDFPGPRAAVHERQAETIAAIPAGC